MRLVAALFLAIATCRASVGQAGGVNHAPKLTILAPAYFYPSGKGLKEWDRLLGSKGLENVTIILDPASGPGKEADPNYIAIIERAKKTRATLIGYVTTSYAKRSLEEVKTEIDRWLKLYPAIHGIFLDEQASAAEHVEYYRSLYDHVRKARGLRLVVTNPGTTCDEGYLAKPCADIVCLFEGLDKPEAIAFPAWTKKYGASAKCALVYNVSSESRMRSILQEVQANGAGVVYVTDEAGVNPWRRLPSYWEAEIEAVLSANRRK